MKEEERREVKQLNDQRMIQALIPDSLSPHN